MMAKVFSMGLGLVSLLLVGAGLAQGDWHAGFGLVGIATAGLCGVAAYLGVS